MHQALKPGLPRAQALETSHPKAAPLASDSRNCDSKPSWRSQALQFHESGPISGQDAYKHSVWPVLCAPWTSSQPPVGQREARSKCLACCCFISGTNKSLSSLWPHLFIDFDLQLLYRM